MPELPEELVQAAMTAMIDHDSDDYPAMAVAALHAAFAKLPECEAVENAIAGRVLWREHEHSPRPCCIEAIFTALAREFGGPDA